MQQKSSKNPILIIVIIIVLAGAAYFYFSGTPSDDSALLTAEETAASTQVSAEAAQIITLLNQTRSLKIDIALFNSPLYRSLVDHTVPVIEQPVGKANPFLYSLPPAATPARR